MTAVGCRPAAASSDRGPPYRGVGALGDRRPAAPQRQRGHQSLRGPSPGARLVTVWAALARGGLSSASLYIGEALAGPMAKRYRATGWIMGFGAGTLLSAVAYELIPASNLRSGLGVGLAVAVGATTYFVGDWVIDHRGGDARQDIDGGGGQGSGAAMFIGALLDGIPEAFILGITLALGAASASPSSPRSSCPTSLRALPARPACGWPGTPAGASSPCGRRSPSPLR